MKSFVILFTLTIVPLLVSAQEVDTNTLTGSPALTIDRGIEVSPDEAINKAIQMRQKLYFIQKDETLEDKNSYVRLMRARIARRDANVQSSIDDGLSREGALDTRVGIRTYQETNPIRTNAKQVFRRCAMNYYFEGGNCTPEELQKGVVYGSTHRVRTAQEAFWKRDMEAISQMRSLQRNLPSMKDAVPTGQQGIMRTETKGGVGREFLTPFTRWYFNPEQ